MTGSSDAAAARRRMARGRRRRRLRVGHRRRLPHAALSRAAADAEDAADRAAWSSSTDSRRGSDTASGTMPLSTQHYAPDVDSSARTRPPRRLRARAVAALDVPRCPTEREIAHECIVDRSDGSGGARAGGARPAPARAALTVRPLLSGRDYHALMHENAAFDFAARAAGGNVTWRPYGSCRPSPRCPTAATRTSPTGIAISSTAKKRRAGSTAREDLAAPGTFTSTSPPATPSSCCAPATASRGRRGGAGRARARVGNRAPRAAVAARPRRRRVTSCAAARATRSSPAIRGSPTGDATRSSRCAGWCSRAGSYAIAASILDRVGRHRVRRHAAQPLPRPRRSARIQRRRRVAVVRGRRRTSSSRPRAGRRRARRLLRAAAAILDGYAAGTRFGIRMDDDGLLACGVPGVQLTWMDARVDGRVITPRIGKPVEIQALWINALRWPAAGYAAMADRAQAAFRARFWNAATGCLYDVVDVDHVAGPRRRERAARTRSSPSAGCRSPSSTRDWRARSWRPSSATS